MKKKLKIIGIALLTIILLLIATPFLFQSQIKDMVKGFINQNLNASLEFSDINLSFISSFPQANVSVKDIVIINFEPFKGETFATVKELSFDMSISELFKKASKEPVIINRIDIDEALLTLKINKEGKANYDIAKKSTTEIKSDSIGTDNSFTLDIKDYDIRKSALTYTDESSNTTIYLNELDHSGLGKFSTEQSELDTETNAKVTFTLGDIKYLENTNIKLDALIGLDLEESIYTFKNNNGFINNLPLQFKGFVKLLENTQEVDITFENPKSSFKDFLAVIPTKYSKNLEAVKTTGDFKINGLVKGIVSENTIPKLAIDVISNNASFKYTDLPKQVDNITINASVKNETGNIDDTYVAINTLNFKIDDDEFKSSATLKNLTKNMFVNANLDGTINLANISKIYPIELENELSGILKSKLNTAFDMNAIEKNTYNKIKNNGFINVSDFIYSSDDIANPININEAEVNFKPGIINLTSFDAKTGTSDINATGTIKNLLGFILSEKKLQGVFNINSNKFAINDFMVESVENQSENKSTEPTETHKIPAFLESTINVNAKTVFYDNLTLKDVKGRLIIKDEKANLQNVTSSIFDGKIALNGLVDTKTETPNFVMDLGISDFDISQSFKDLEILQTLAPIAKVLQGKLNSTIKLSGNLGNNFTPDLNSISGDALTELLTTTLLPKDVKVFSGLQNSLSFIDFDKLDLNDLKTLLKFENGKVNVSPFKLNYKDINISVDGSHGFNKSMSYNATFDVPAKYLGSEVTNLISKIDDGTIKDLTIPVTAIISGTFTNPTVNTDLTSGVADLTKQLIEIQKQKILNTGKDKLSDLLGGIIGGNTKEKDSTSTKGNNTVKDVLGGILGGDKNPKDSTKTETKEVKDILGGLFGGKNKKKKDTVN